MVLKGVTWTLLYKICDVMQIQREWPSMVGTLICLLVKSIAEASQPVLLGEMFNLLGKGVDSALRGAFGVGSAAKSGRSHLMGAAEYLFGIDSDANMAKSVITLLFLTACLRALSHGVNIYLHSLVQEKARIRLRKLLFSHLLEQEKAYFDVRSFEEIRVLIRAESISEVVGWRVFYFFADAVRLVVFVFYMSYVSLGMTAISVIGLPLSVAISQKYVNNRIRELEGEERGHITRADAGAAEAIRLVETVKSFSREDLHIATYHRHLDAARSVVDEKNLRRGLWEFISHIIQTGIFCACLWFVFVQQGQGNLSSGELTSFLLMFSQIRDAGNQIEEHYREVVKHMVHIRLMFDFMARRSCIEPGPRGGELRGRVEFKNVRFSYQTRAEVEVLRGISFSMRPGRVTALVGASGAGKSTIASLLMRHYDVSDGSLLLDGKDIKTYDLENMHEQVVIVSQNPMLFNLSMRENITYGLRREVPDEELFDAARRAQIHDFLKALPDGYDTMAGEGGTRLSGGQRQRIAIARAMIMRPPVLILDEATSSLDAENEAKVHKAMAEAMHKAGASVLVIAHRLSTIMNAEEILCMSGGRVIESGSHEQLLKKGGYYADLLKKQLPKVAAWS